MILTNHATGNDSHAKLLIQSNNANGSTVFTDLSAVGNTITGYGGLSHSTAAYKNGKSSIYFDGTDDYLSIPDSENWNFGSGDFSIEFFVRFSANNSNYTIISQKGNSGNIGWTVQYSGGNIALFRSYDGINQVSDLYYIFVPVVGQWYHILISRQDGLLRLYADGIKRSEITDGNSFYNSASPLQIGTQNSVAFLNGYLDQIRISTGIARKSIPPNRMF